jgi:hypothetical protein
VIHLALSIAAFLFLAFLAATALGLVGVAVGGVAEGFSSAPTPDDEYALRVAEALVTIRKGEHELRPSTSSAERLAEAQARLAQLQ